MKLTQLIEAKLGEQASVATATATAGAVVAAAAVKVAEPIKTPEWAKDEAVTQK